MYTIEYSGLIGPKSNIGQLQRTLTDFRQRRRLAHFLGGGAFGHGLGFAIGTAQRNQRQSFEVFEHALAFAVLAVVEPLRLAIAPQLQDIPRRRPLGQLFPEFIPDPLGRIPQEDSRAQLQEPSRQHAPPFLGDFLQDHQEHRAPPQYRE